MDFSKPIMAEIIGTDEYVDEFREYLRSNKIVFTEETYEFYTETDVHNFACQMTDEQLIAANLETNALFYQ